MGNFLKIDRLRPRLVMYALLRKASLTPLSTLCERTRGKTPRGCARAVAMMEGAVSELTRTWLLAFGSLILIVIVGFALMERQYRWTRADEINATAAQNLKDDIIHIAQLARYASLGQTGPFSLVLPMQVQHDLDDAVRHLRDWTDDVNNLGLASPMADQTAAQRVKSLSEALKRSALLLMRFPEGTPRLWGRLAVAAEAALAAGSMAATRAAGRAERSHADLMRRATAFAILVVGALISIALLLVRPLTQAYAARGRRLTEMEARMAHGALHDPLTGLPNRRHLTEHLTGVLAAAGRSGRVAAALHIDLDRFQSINDSLGIAVGDRVLRRCATIMRAETRRSDFITRVGADEFVIVLSQITNLEELTSLGARLIERLGEPIVLDGDEVRMGASVGIALAEPNKLNTERLLMNAGLALLDAKSGGRNRYAMFTEGRRTEFEKRRRVATELRDALTRDELEPFFQPQVCARTGRPVGFEALVRWRHPERGLLTPFHFLDVAEETGLIEEIGELVTRRALSALAIWRSMGLPAERIGINISAKELRDSGFVDKLSWDVDASGLQPCNVGIEILESVLIDDDNDPVIRNVAALSSAGFSVELDDFGTGHASIGNLKKFRVNKIKIDRSFITDIDTQPDQQKITRAMINLAHSLDVEALVEGVETEAELHRLRAMGCDAVQGYLIGRPMAEADALIWLKSQVNGKSPYWVNGSSDDVLSGGLGV